MQLAPNETIIKQEQAMMMQLFARFGTLTLTNQRVIFETRLNMYLGLIGLLMPSFGVKAVIDAPFSQIKKFEKTTFGLNKNMLLLATNDQEITLNLNSKYEIWEEAYKKAR